MEDSAGVEAVDFVKWLLDKGLAVELRSHILRVSAKKGRLPVKRKPASSVDLIKELQSDLQILLGGSRIKRLKKAGITENADTVKAMVVNHTDLFGGIDGWTAKNLQRRAALEKDGAGYTATLYWEDARSSPVWFPAYEDALRSSLRIAETLTGRT